MKINRLEAHDRLLHLKQDQSINIAQGAEDCLKINPLSLAIQEKSPYIYLFAHPRTADDGVNKKMLWDPRLSIPEVQPNSYLFRAISKTDSLQICWLLPPKEMWAQYKYGNVTEHELVLWSIEMYNNNRAKLTEPHPDDMPEDSARQILRAVIDEHRQHLRMKKLYAVDSI
jgi:hypothetical protein